MAEERVQRRLAAILAADVVGYSRLMGEDEAGTVSRLKKFQHALLEPKVAAYGGRLFKTAGDGMMVEFPSAVDAVSHAVEVQRALALENAELADDQRFDLRIGISLGDVIVEGEDLYGNGVNVAARLEGIAEPGGICVSGNVHEHAANAVDVDFLDLGPQQVKNIAEPVRSYRVVLEQSASPAKGPEIAPDLYQDIRFCTAPDGVQLAYSTVGEGPALVKTANWFNHLEHDWDSPVWSGMLRAFARGRRLIRYDERANGLSDWDVEDISFDAFVQDLETVVESAGLDRFALLGISQGCSVSIAYAVAHPDRVSHLVLFGGFAAGWRLRSTPSEIARREAMGTLAQVGWGQDNPTFRQVFTSHYLPDAKPEQAAAWSELQRITTSPENAVRLMDAFSSIDVRPLLGQVTVPTLVIHCRDEFAVPLACSREITAKIPGARFVMLDSRNHIILDHEPDWAKYLDEVDSFLSTPESVLRGG